MRSNAEKSSELIVFFLKTKTTTKKKIEIKSSLVGYDASDGEILLTKLVQIKPFSTKKKIVYYMTNKYITNNHNLHKLNEVSNKTNETNQIQLVLKVVVCVCVDYGCRRVSLPKCVM